MLCITFGILVVQRRRRIEETKKTKKKKSFLWLEKYVFILETIPKRVIVLISFKYIK